MRLLLPDLQTGQQYKVQVRSTDGSSVSEWSQVYDISTTSDAIAPAPPTALSWTVDGTAFVATWVAPTTNSDSSTLMDFQDYQITVFWSGAPTEKAVYYVAGTRFDFPFEVNSNSFTAPRATVTIEVRARDNTGNLSTVVTATATNAAPANVTGLTVSGGQGTIYSTWTAVADLDLNGYEVYASLTNGFTPGPANFVSTTTQTSFLFKANAGETWYVKVRAIDIFGTGSAAYASGNATAKAITDGLAPASSPTPTVISMINGLFVRWTPIVNADAVSYEVHVSTASGFTPSSTTLVGTTASSFMSVMKLPGPAPAPGQPDTRSMAYGTIYYVKVIAKDADGSAAAGTEVSGTTNQVSGPDLAVGSVTANNVVAGTFTGQEFAGTVFIGNNFKTAETGQRAEFGVDGFKAFKSTGALKFEVTTDDSDTFVDGEFIARGLTVTGGASFQSAQNEITADSVLTLMRGIVPPTAVPQLSITWDTLRPDTTTPQTGQLGTFTLTPSEVQCINYHSNFNIYQFHNGGTRVWRYDLTGAFLSFTDFADIQITSEVWLPAPSSGNGWMMVKFIPNGQYYVFHDGNYFGYTTIGPTGSVPTVMTDGTSLGIVETTGSPGVVNIGYRTQAVLPTVHGVVIPAATSTVTTSSSRAYGSLKFHVLKDTFDGSTLRYIVSEIGSNFNGRTFNTTTPTAAWLDEDWNSPTSNKRGIAYDGTNIWTYGADGYLYKHTSTRWPTTVSDLWFAKITFYDDVGTTHETLPGAVTSVNMKRRAKLLFTPPPIPDNGGVDDPKKVRLYMSVGTTPPANAYPGDALTWLQSTTAVPVSITTLATAGTNATAATGNFPLTSPAKIKSDDNSLIISGDGSINATLVTESLPHPYSYGHVNANTAAITTAVWTGATYTIDSSSGITHSAGTFTVPIAGRYRTTVAWTIASSAAGTARGARILYPSGAQSVEMAFAPEPATGGALSRSFVSDSKALLAGGTIIPQTYQDSGAGLAIIGDAAGIRSTVRIEYLGA